MILTYRILSILIYPLLVVLIFFRKIINKEDKIRYKEKIFPSSFKVNRNENNKLIWFNAASVGEFKSIIPIIKKIDKNDHFEILITTNTLSSGNLAKGEIKKFKKVQHRFLPLDVDFLIDKFLFMWKPDKIFLVDSEVWPNLILNAKKYEIPIAMLNARLTKKSFNRWIKFPGTAKKIFGLFDLCLSSNIETKNFLERLNAKNIFSHGNIKLSNEISFDKIKNTNEQILLKKRFWIASSTHDQEELFCLKVHTKLKQKFNDIMTIIAPRHINRSVKVKKLCESLKLTVQLLNKDEKILDNKDVIIINSFGVLQEYFKFAKSVFIGKSILFKLRNDGGQNPIDAAKLNCKIYHGPYIYNFEEIYKILEINDISKKINSSDDLYDNLVKDLEFPTKKIHKYENTINDLGQKTLSDTMKNINNFILDDNKKT